MARNNKTYTSDEIAQMLSTNPVVIRRTMAGLKKAGFIHSEKGPKGGWSLVEDLSKITLFDIYNAVGEPTIFAMGNERVNPDCAVERVVNAALDDAMNQAQTILLTQLKATTLADLALEFDQICTKQSFS